MSPLSVSTYLSPDMKFDVVIFDEASQIFPQDAVGAIYRGKQLIVVGDSKQMPPSNFFNSSMDVDSDDESEDITDFEFKSYVEPHFNLVESYLKNYLIPDYCAFFIFSALKKSCNKAGVPFLAQGLASKLASKGTIP